MRIFISFMAIGIGLFSLSRLSFIDMVYLVTQNKESLIKNKYKIYHTSVSEVRESKSFRTFMSCRVHIKNDDGTSFFTLEHGEIADFSEKVEKNDTLLIYYSNNLHDPHEVYNISKKKYVFTISYRSVLIYKILLPFFVGVIFTSIGIGIFFRKGYLWNR